MGRQFPVNSYACESIDVLAEAAVKVLKDEQSGIDEIRISRESKGQGIIVWTGCDQDRKLA